MEVVTSSLIMRKFRGIKEYTMDLGISKTTEVEKEGNKGPGQIVIKIKDPFIKRYSLEKGNYIVKAGNIGSLVFYIDNSMMGNKFSIYDEDGQFDFDYKETGNVRQYLSDILDKILSGELEPTNILTQNLEEDIEFRMDKNLPQHEFMAKHKEMKEEMAKMDVNPYKNKY
jgi:hypothetical protein